MSRSMPPMNWFRVFEAAARHLKFTAAADELGITQSAVSQQIRLLELRLGTPLFLRQPKGISLTDAGRKLLPHVAASMEHLSVATQLFDVGPTQDVLTVATSVSIAQCVIAPELTHFGTICPDVRLRLLSTIWADDFKSTVADVEIRFGSAAAAGQNARRLAPDVLVAVGLSKWVRDLENAPLIEAVGTSEGWRDWARVNQVGWEPKPILFVDSYGMAITLAQQGAGVALVSALLVQPLIDQCILEQIGEAVPNPTEGYFFALNQASQTAQAFESWFFSLPNFRS